MIYEEFAPAADLRHLVASGWRFALEPGDGEKVRHVIPPDATVSLVWLRHARIAVLVGPQVEALSMEIEQGSEYVGVRFRPGVAGSVLGIEVEELRGERRVFPALRIGVDTVEGIRQELEAAVRRLSQHAAPPDAIVMAMVDRMLSEESMRVTQVVEGLGITYRQALRRFQAAVGVSPKEFLRLRRIRAACVRALGEEGWAAISAETGYADQAHLAREFQRAFGWPPRLVQAYLRQIEHRGIRA